MASRAEGTSLAYLVAGSHARSSSSAHSHGTTRTGREAAEEAGAGVVESLGSTEAHDVDEVHTGSRRTPFAQGNS